MGKKTLLLIDRSRTLMELTGKILKRAGYSVFFEERLAGAREWLGKHTPDGIIMENELPDGVGIDFLRELRNESRIPVLVLSADEEDELPVLRSGANDFLKKPCDYSVLVARIDVMLDGVTHRREEKDEK